MLFMDVTAWNMRNIVIRMLTAMVLGGVIGIDRGAKRRGGGARTDAAVCIGAALVMITGQYMEIRFPGLGDLSRMASQVIRGVGFLGAGSILVSGHQVSCRGDWICRRCVSGHSDSSGRTSPVAAGGGEDLPVFPLPDTLCGSRRGRGFSRISASSEDGWM